MTLFKDITPQRATEIAELIGLKVKSSRSIINKLVHAINNVRVILDEDKISLEDEIDDIDYETVPSWVKVLRSKGISEDNLELLISNDIDSKEYLLAQDHRSLADCGLSSPTVNLLCRIIQEMKPLNYDMSVQAVPARGVYSYGPIKENRLSLFNEKDNFTEWFDNQIYLCRAADSSKRNWVERLSTVMTGDALRISSEILEEFSCIDADTYILQMKKRYFDGPKKALIKAELMSTRFDYSDNPEEFVKKVRIMMSSLKHNITDREIIDKVMSMIPRDLQRYLDLKIDYDDTITLV